MKRVLQIFAMRNLIVFVLIFFSVHLSAQTKSKIYTIHVYGNGAGGGDSCMLAANAKYGFKLIGGGCRPIHRKIRGNQKKLAKLDKLNGEGWREKYKTEFRSCRKDYDLHVWFEQDWYRGY